MSCACFVCGLISMLLTLYIGRIKNVLAAVKITCGSLFFSVFGNFFSSSADFRVDLRHICATTWIIMDLMAKIHSFRLFFAFVKTSLFVFVLNYCFILLIKLNVLFSLQFFKKLLFYLLSLGQCSVL